MNHIDLFHVDRRDCKQKLIRKQGNKIFFTKREQEEGKMLVAELENMYLNKIAKPIVLYKRFILS